MRTLIIAVLLAGCGVGVEGVEDAGVETAPIASHTCGDVVTSVPVVKGDVLTTDLRNFTVNNGVARIRYGAHAMDFQDLGVTWERDDRHLDHVLAARHTDSANVATTPGCLGACHNGTHWHDTTYSSYGDGATFSSGTINQDADRVRVLEASTDAVELAYEWDVVRLDGLRSATACNLGNFPECGPTDKDSEGHAVWKDRNIDQVKSVKVVKLWKTVRMERCSPGYFVAMRSDPPLRFPEQGDRSIRTGYVATHTAWSCDGLNTVQHPNAGFHFELGTNNCIADIARDDAGTHDGWPFIRFLKTYGTWRMMSLQYSPGQLGSPGVADMWDTTGPDGRPVKWQAFIGAVEYTSPNPSLEPTQIARDLAIGAAGGVVWPQ